MCSNSDFLRWYTNLWSTNLCTSLFCCWTLHFPLLISLFILPILHLCPKQGAFRNLSCTVSCTQSDDYVALKWLSEAIGQSQSKCSNGWYDWCQRLEPLVSGIGTRGSRHWNQLLQALEPKLKPQLNVRKKPPLMVSSARQQPERVQDAVQDKFRKASCLGHKCRIGRIK